MSDLLDSMNKPIQGDSIIDLAIKNERIINGTGSPEFAGDVGIRDGKLIVLVRTLGLHRRIAGTADSRVQEGFLNGLSY